MSKPITAVVARRSRMQMTAETRSTLLKLARQMFGKTGYADASMDELTAAAGMTRGALYHHFGSKQGLFEAVVEQIDEEMDDQLKAVTPNEKEEWKASGVRSEDGRVGTKVVKTVEPWWEADA